MNDHTRKTGRTPQPPPIFMPEEEMHEFWKTHDSTAFWDQMEDVTATPPTQLGIGPGRVGSRARKRPA